MICLEATQKDAHLMLHNATISNFKGFKLARLTDAKRINVIVGRNGSGKTALLEALFLASGGSPEIVIREHSRRGVDYNFRHERKFLNDAIWREIFYMYDKNNIPDIRFEGSGRHTRGVRVYFEPENGAKEESPLFDASDLTTTLESELIETVVFEWTDDLGNKERLKPRVGDGLIDLPHVTSPLAFIAMYYAANHNFSLEENRKRFSEYSIEKNEPTTVSVIKKLFPDIQKIDIQDRAGLAMLHAELASLPRKVPLNFVSAGLNKLVSIFLGIEQKSSSIAFIDEIENGIHYTVHGPMWAGLLDMADRFDTQIFATTHSRECLDALVKYCHNRLDDISFVRVERQDDGNRIEQFSGLSLESALEMGEVR